MKPLIMRVIRWPLYSPLRFVTVLAALVVLGVVAGNLNDDPSQQESANATAASDGGGTTEELEPSDGGGDPSDGGGSETTAGGDLSEAENVTTQAVSALVTREAPDSDEWKEAAEPFVAGDVIGQWDDAGWKPAEDAPITVEAVTFETSDELGADTAARWERIAVAHVVNGDDVPREYPFRVEARKGQDGWVVTRLVSLDGVDE